MASPLLPRCAAAFLVAAAVALPLAGCGGSSNTSSAGGDPGADPASFMPASAPAYAEAQLQPDGDLGANTTSVAGKILRTGDPAGKITGLIDQGLKDEGGSYASDIKPWLGKRAGVAVVGVGAGGAPDAVAALVSTDDDAAGKFVDGLKGTTARTYRGVTYQFKADGGVAAAVVSHAVLVGSERGLKSAIDAQSGAKLSAAGNFEEARKTVGTDGLGFVYVDPARVFDLVMGAVPGGTGGAGGAAASQAMKGLLAGSGLRSVAASLNVKADALQADVAVIGAKTQAGAAGDGPGAAAAVPAGSWLSVGIGDVGGSVTRALAGLGKAGGGAATGGIDPSVMLQQLEGGLGVDLQKDFLSWMGDASLFVRGTTMDDLGGALVINSKDPAKSKAAIATIRRLLQTIGARPAELTGVSGATGLTLKLGPVPGGIDIAAKDDKFVIAYGHDALKDALAGGATLGDSAPFKTAAGLLDGAKPSIFLDIPQIVKLAGTFAGSDPDFAKAKPTLDAFGPAAAGVSSSGDVTRLKMAVAVP
jgi:hypothetical protein